MRTLLEARQATFARAGDAVFRPLDVQLAGGQAVVVRGPNGAGKTTLLRLLAGILRPAAGRVERHAPVAFIGHLNGIKLDLNCREHLEFQRRLAGSESGLPATKALARLGLAELGLRPARSLSAGQKRRLALAGLLAAPRAVWLLDEPYAGLDHDGGERVDQLLDEHLARDGAVVLSTHQRQPRIRTDVRTIELAAGGAAA